MKENPQKNRVKLYYVAGIVYIGVAIIIGGFTITGQATFVEDLISPTAVISLGLIFFLGGLAALILGRLKSKGIK